MRIFGGHDYYDGAQAFGHDPIVVLQRHEKELVAAKAPAPSIEKSGYYNSECWVRIKTPHKQKKWQYSNTFQHQDLGYTVTPFRVVFCGKIYRGVKVSCARFGLYNPTPEPEYFWDEKVFVAWLAQFGCTLEKKSDSYWLKGVENKLFKHETVSEEERNWLVEKRISILVQSGEGEPQWLVNPPVLAKVMFYRLFEATQAFQELDMWISGVLGKPANDMVELSDDYKISKHGFDKHSFRKSKS